MPRVKRSLIIRGGLVLALLCSALQVSASDAAAGEKEDEADLRRSIRELQKQNRELSKRLNSLESAAAVQRARRSHGHAGATDAAAAHSSTVTASSIRSSAPGLMETAKKPAGLRVEEPDTNPDSSIEERVRDLEIAHRAQEHATRQIIQDSFTKAGPKINSNLALSGVVEYGFSRTRDFLPEVNANHPFGSFGPVKEKLALGTAELDFDIRLSDWLKGSLVLTFDNSSSTRSPTGAVAGVERFTLDRTHVTIGDETQFPILARFGSEIMSFGTSTGVARLDTLSLSTPITTEVFENRQIAGGLQFAFPTPPLAPPPAPVVNPPVQPLVIAPLVSHVARWLGYNPLPQRVVPPTPVRPPAELPPIYGSIMFYKGSEDFGPGRTHIQDFNASVGYRTHGHCGVPYEELRSSLVCPWTFDFHVDYSTSVFESKFLRSSYQPFLAQIGSVPGVSASVKTSLGPFALVGEVNSAIEEAGFFDGLGIARGITPMTWQASLAYQFNWNPWVREIGAQGNFISLAYSGSHDLAGAFDVINGIPTRVGFVPAHRFSITAGEWVMQDLKVAVEHSTNWDYKPSQGGTGQRVHNILGVLQFNY